MKSIASLINCIWCAFATYSRIPVPKADWDGEGLRWQICCFPLVGAVIGILWAAAAELTVRAGLHPALGGAVLTVWPLVLTGGIHMDGYLDTTDAIHSWKSPAERLEILKDPHIGAFALIGGASYLLLQYGLMVQLCVLAGAGAASGAASVSGRRLLIAAVASGFVLSRILSGISVVGFPSARREGMLQTVSSHSDPRAKGVLLAELALFLAASPAAAVCLSAPEFLALPAAAIPVFAWYHRMALRRFGGVTGDLAGWFLQVSELAMLTAAVCCRLWRG